MSGITPILDTLLHQVLGRRANLVRRALLDQPIPPPQSGQASARAHSDSRLDPRPLVATARTGQATGAKVTATTMPAAAAVETSTPASAVARFSHAGRIIANVLTQFPAPPSALRPSAPLLGAGEPVSVRLLALRLRQSIEGSGVFYESHLRRWQRGSFPLSQLLREPQAQWLRQAVGARMAQAPLPGPPLPGAAAETHSAPSVARRASHGADTPGGSASPRANVAAPAPAPASVPLPAPAAYGADGRPLPGLTVLTPRGEAAAVQAPAPAPAAAGAQAHGTGMEATVRHQLELLAAPVLRWEGQPWAGLFMALVLQPPPQPPGHQQEDESEHKREAATPWTSRLTLRLARLGEVQVDLRLGARHLALDLQAEPQALQRLRDGRADLHERLGALGFAEVAVRVQPRAAGGGEHDGPV